MVEINAAIAAERLNKQITELPATYREVFRGAVKNIIQSGFKVGETPLDRIGQVRASVEQEPFLRALIAAPPEEVPEPIKLRANQDLIAGEKLRREMFP